MIILRKLIPVLFVILITFLGGCLFNSTNNENAFTLLELKNIADTYINEMNISGNFNLCEGKCWDHSKNGKYLSGRFQYADTLHHINNTTIIKIWIKNGIIEREKNVFHKRIDQEIGYELISFSKVILDSDEAISLAKHNEIIRTFLSNGKKKGVYHSSVNLAPYVKTLIPRYHLSWNYEEPKENQEMSADIWINAENGNVINVMADGVDS